MHDISIRGLEMLAEERFVFGSTQEILGEDLIVLADWPSFQAIFEDLPADAYLSDDNELVLQPHRPYSQPKYFNPLNGGMKRHFAPLTEAILNNRVVQRVL